MPEVLDPLSDTGSILDQKDKQWDHGQFTMNHSQMCARGQGQGH